MHRNKSMIVLALSLSAFVVAAIVGCSSASTSSSGPSSGASTNGGSAGMMRPGGSSGGASGGVNPNGNNGGGSQGNGPGAGSYSSVGQRIYLTGAGVDGRDISRTAPRVSQGALMMGGGGCGSCHGPKAQGGTIRMMMGTTIKAPNITYGSLLKNGFTDATIRKAIRDGLDETGKALDVAMPRWQMSDGDLDATIAYLKQLGP